MGKDIRINSNLESSQLGFYTKTIKHTSRGTRIEIRNNCGLSNVTLNARKGILIKDGAGLGAGAKIYDNDFHDLYNQQNADEKEVSPAAEVVIGHNAFVGAGSMFLKNVNSGDGATVGAGSVVVKAYRITKCGLAILQSI